MKKLPRWGTLFCSICLGGILGSPSLLAGRRVYFTDFFPPSEFRERRMKVMQAIGPEAIALIRGNEGMPGYQEFAQNNNTFYLCGVESPGAILLIDGGKRESHLFLPPQNLAREHAEGAELIPDEETRTLTGIEDVLSTSELMGVLTGILEKRRIAYVPLAPQELQAMSRDLAERYNRERQEDPWDGRVSREAHFAGLLKERYPQVEVKDLSGILDRLRLIKSPREIEALRRAAQLSEAAILEAMKSTRPGQYEYELDALGQFIFLRNGAEGVAYYGLVAAAENAYMNHYHRGNRRLREEDFLLYDFGPEYQSYTSDVTRMWPVSGKFSPWQRELYGFYLQLYRALMSRIRPAVPVRKIMQEVASDWEEVLGRTTFSKGEYSRAARQFVAAYRSQADRSSGHSLGHWVGLATHDDGGPVTELQPGMVLTIEPQFRVPEEEIYIRLEDVLVITPQGVENLSSSLPTDIEAIESVMKEKGLLESYPRVF